MTEVVLDAAGGSVGGAARWVAELDRYLALDSAPITVIGRSRALTPSWLLRRESKARGASCVVAANNVSFAVSGAHRKVLVHNALHFLYPGESHLLRVMPRMFCSQIPVVRRLLARSDVIVVPASAMAERVGHHVPKVRDRIVVRAHPVTPVGSRCPADRPFVLVPVVPAPYKDLVPHLQALLDAIAWSGRDLSVKVTASAGDLPPALSQHPRLTALGIMPHRELTALWRSATAVFFPCTVEAFGFPLAEARAYGLPVLSPDTTQAHEVAGKALVPYRQGDPDSLTEALSRMDASVAPESDAFNAQAYFRWFLDLPLRRFEGAVHGTDTQPTV